MCANSYGTEMGKFYEDILATVVTARRVLCASCHHSSPTLPPFFLCSGTWKFLLADAVAKTPKGFESPEFSDSSWGDIRVPGHWQLQTAGARDPPIYTNTNYPFPNHPPYAPRKNPTGLYRRGFALPPEWLFAEGDGVGDTGKEWDGRFVVGQVRSSTTRMASRLALLILYPGRIFAQKFLGNVRPILDTW